MPQRPEGPRGNSSRIYSIHRDLCRIYGCAEDIALGGVLHIYGLHWPTRDPHRAFMVMTTTIRKAKRGFSYQLIKSSLLNSLLFPLSLFFIARGIRDGAWKRRDIRA